MIIEEYGIYSGHENWGGAAFANAAPINLGFREHMLLRFELPDLTSLGVDEASEIPSATLTLRRSDWLSHEGILRLYRLKESWGEGTHIGSETVYASEIYLGGPEGEYGPESNAVDWSDRYHGTAAWSVPGAVGGGSSEGTPSVVYHVAGEYAISLDVTSDVRYWYQNGTNLLNLGWVMTCEDSDGQWRVGVRFFSDDHYQPELRPRLTIIPEPATLSLLALGSLAVLRRRKK